MFVLPGFPDVIFVLALYGNKEVDLPDTPLVPELPSVPFEPEVPEEPSVPFELL